MDEARRPPSVRSIPLALILFLLAGCAAREDPSSEPLAGVVLIVLDTLRADHVSSYGYDRPTTPSIDALAARGVSFDQVRSSAPWTLPSVAALLTGEDPQRAFGGQAEIRSSLVERLRDAGVATAAVTEGGYVSREFGFDRGFESYREEEGAVQLLEAGEKPADPALGEIGLQRVFDGARAFLRENLRRPFFLLVHTYEPHVPYTNHRFAAGLDPGRIGRVFRIEHLAGIRSGRITPTAAEKEYVTALYDGDIAAADAQVGALVEELRELGLEERVAVIVTSDHGEELGGGYPSGLFDHGHSLRDNLLRTPLVVRDPRAHARGRHVATQVGLVDVMPTVCELLGVEIDPSLPGRSLVPSLEGREQPDQIVFSSATKRGPYRVSVCDGRYKLIAVRGPAPEGENPLLREVPAEQLYDLVDDPRETRNLVAERPRLAATLREALDRRFGDASSDDEFEVQETQDPALQERLRSLGYTR